MFKKYLLIGLFQIFVINSVCAYCDVLRIVETQASDNMISNQFLRKELNARGYTTEIISASSSKEAYELLRLNKADIYLGTWIPLDLDVINPYILQGQVKTMGIVLSNIQIGIAANESAKDLGVISVEQLKSSHEDLKPIIYVGKPDWSVVKKLDNILKHSTYQLTNYKIIRLTNKQLEKKLYLAELHKKPIIFYSRKMNAIADKYAKHFLFHTIGALEDIHSQMTIYSSVRYKFVKECPDISPIIQDFHLEPF